MPTLTPETLNDLQISTLPAFERGRFTEIATDLREYHVFPNLVLFKDDPTASNKRMETRDGGTRVEFDVMTNHNGASRNTTIASADNPVKVDVLQRATVPWRFTTTQWSEYQQEVAMNSGDYERIVDVQLAQDKAALISLAVLMENNWWGAPVDSADTTTPYGCFTWFPKSSSSGFLGAFPSGFTTLGLNNQHSRWKHYVDAYTETTSEDLFQKLWLACLRTMFKNPVAGIPNLDQGVQRGTYMNTPTYVAFAREAMRQNDNVGYDLTRAQGITYFMNVPCFTVPKLDADTTNPVLNLDWATIQCIALKSWWLKRLNINNYPGYHTTNARFIDSQYNFVCWNRRKNSVLATGTTYPS